MLGNVARHSSTVGLQIISCVPATKRQTRRQLDPSPSQTIGAAPASHVYLNDNRPRLLNTNLTSLWSSANISLVVSFDVFLGFIFCHFKLYTNAAAVR